MSNTVCGPNGNMIPEFNKRTPDYNGQAVRIIPYWSSAVFNDVATYNKSWVQIRNAHSILSEHTLSLDVLFSGGGFVVPLEQGFLFNMEGEKEFLNNIFNLINTRDASTGFRRQEDRLIVLFAHLFDVPGVTMLRPHWLPFVIVDPRKSSPRTLVHEIAHASRCAHVEGSLMESCGDLNATNFHNIHAWEIYRSYWCTGFRPQSWWEYGSSGNLLNRGPYMWPPYFEPSR
jgi:hypothetical protein